METSHWTGGLPACGRQQSCATQFSEMRAHCGASPPIAAYNALLKVVCMCGKLEAAVDIVCELEAVGLQPVQVTWDILLKSARQQDRHDIIAAVRASPLTLHLPHTQGDAIMESCVYDAGGLA